MVFGLLQFSLSQYIITTLIMTHVTVVGVSIYLHRSQTHRSLALNPLVEHFFRLWLWLSTGMVTKEWVAIHRKHHAYVETEADPHSPKTFGLRKVLWEGAELYREESKNLETMDKYGFGTPDDWMERSVYTRYSKWGIALMLLINLALFGIPGLSIWAIQMMWIPFFAAGVVNGVGHHAGYRNFESLDASRNIFPIGILMGGEELHNNHHTYASSAKFSVKKWEFDVSWLYIRLLSFLGLATVKKVAPKLSQVPGKVEVDHLTLQALLVDRFSILSNYTKQVLFPVLKDSKEGNHTTEQFRFNKQLVKQNKKWLTDNKKQALESLLQSCDSLRVVYQLREQLQDLWSQTLNQNELLEKLQKWCRQAEASGIKALSEFVNSLKSLVIANERMVAIG